MFFSEYYIYFHLHNVWQQTLQVDLFVEIDINVKYFLHHCFSPNKKMSKTRFPLNLDGCLGVTLTKQYFMKF